MGGKQCIKRNSGRLRRAVLETLERRVLLDGALTLSSEVDVAYETAKQWYWSDVVVSDAPAGATVTRVDYAWKVDANLVTDVWWQLKGPGYTGATNTGMENTGGDIFSGYSQSSEGTVTLAPPGGTAVNGTWSFGVYDSFDDFADVLNSGRIDSWSITINYTVPTAPAEIQVTGNTYNIVNNDTTPTSSDGTNFGTSYLGLLGVERSFVVKNTGTGPLSIGTVTVPAGFSVTQSLMSVISPGSSAALSLRADTTAAGAYSGNVTIANNDSDENPYTFAITAIVAVPMPDIQVTGNGINIVNGDSTPATSDGTSFGTAVLGKSAPKRSFVVKNTGTGTLSLDSTAVPNGFSITQALPSSLTAGSSATLTIAMNMSTVGTYSGDVRIVNNDAGGADGVENPFVFQISGQVTPPAPEIRVSNAYYDIHSGDTTPSTTDSTDFGSALHGQPAPVTYFGVQNIGTAPLNIGQVTVPTGFRIVQSIGGQVGLGSTVWLGVRLDTQLPGSFSGEVVIPNDDSDESPFTFRIAGTVKAMDSLSAEEYDGIRKHYPSFELPTDISQINKIVFPAGQLDLAGLKNAVVAAGLTAGPDLIVLRTTDTSNTITYTGSTDEVKIDIPPSYGATSIIGLGSRPLTIDGAGKSRVVSVGNTGSLTNPVANLGNVILNRGSTPSDGGGLAARSATIRLADVAISGSTATGSGGGIWLGNCTTTLSNVTISGNSAGTSGGGLFQTNGTLSFSEGMVSDNSEVAGKYPAGGGLYLSGVVASLTHLDIRGNHGTYGGGISQSGGSLVLMNSELSENVAYAGGGLNLGGAVTATVRDVVISGNQASGYGGAVAQTSGTSTLTNLAIFENHSYDGAGLYVSAATVGVRNSELRRNTADSFGGGVYVSDTTTALDIVDCILAQNDAVSGGGLYVYTGRPTLRNVTIAGNTAASAGGGIGGYTGGPTLYNTIVAQNVKGDIHVRFTTQPTGSNNLIGNGEGLTQIINGANGNIVGTAAAPIDPMLAEIASAGQLSLSPLAGSPVIDAGDNFNLRSDQTTDVFGAARVQGARVNIGAVETVLPVITGTTLVVTSLSDNTDVDGAVTLREALAAANGNVGIGDARAGSYAMSDRIEFAPGLFGDIHTNGRPYELTSDLVLAGPGSGNIRLNAAGNGRVLDIGGVNAAVSGLALVGGSALDGGGVRALGARLTLDDVLLQGNAATRLGGGAYAFDSYLELTNSVISDNNVTGEGELAGGGICARFGAISLSKVTISGNSVNNVYYANGGGIEASSVIEMSDVTIERNTATGRGGGAYLAGGPVSLDRVVIAGNAATSAGGITVTTNTTLTNVSIIGNSAETGGGLIAGSRVGQVVLTNVTIAGNSAAQSGGGLQQDDFGTLAVRNSIISGNTAPFDPDVDVSAINYPVSASNCLIGDGGTRAAAKFFVNGQNGNIVGSAASPIDPNFVNLAADDWTLCNLRLRGDSPAVNAGSNDWIPTGVETDVAGRARITDGVVDMGAYERDVDAPTVVSSSTNDGAAQRSMVKTAGVVFNEAVDLLEGAIWLRGQNGLAVPDIVVKAEDPLGDGRTWRLTFSGDAIVGESLPDGIYSLVVSADKVADLAGNALRGDYSQRFHRLFGDADGDRDVDSRDLAMFRQSQNRPIAYRSIFDYNGDAKIDVTDYRQLQRRLCTKHGHPST